MANSNLINELLAQFNANPRRVFARLANEYRKAGDPQSAIDICRTHVPLQPTYISGHIVFGQALFDSGQLDDARATFETAIELDPENLIAVRQLGDIARVLGDSAGARAWYERLLEMDPQNEEIEQYVRDLPAEAPSHPVTVDGPVAETAAGEQATTDGASRDSAPAAEPVVEMPPAPAFGMVEPAVFEPQEPEREMVEPWAPPDTPGPLAASHTDTPEEFPAVSHAGTPEEPPAEPHADAADEPPASSLADMPEDATPPDALLAPEHDVFDWSMLAPAAPERTQDADSLLDIAELAPRAEAEADAVEPHAAEENEPDSAARMFDTPSFDMNTVMFPEIDISNSSAAEPIPESAAHLLGGEIDLSAVSEPDAGLPDMSVASVEPVEWADLLHDEPAEPSQAEPTEPAQDEPPEAESVAPSAFVTETMAELYLRQGHLSDAMAIYHQLVARRPDDVALRERMARLEAAPAPPSRVAAQPVGRTVREFFASFASRRAPTDNGRDSAAIALHGDQPIGADGLFRSGDILSDDQARADALAAAYTPRGSGAGPSDAGEDSGGFSLEHVFRDEPASAAVAADAMPDVSFDEFFDRRSDEAPAAGDAGDASPAEQKPGDDDLELFQAWLEGLKK